MRNILELQARRALDGCYSRQIHRKMEAALADFWRVADADSEPNADSDADSYSEAESDTEAVTVNWSRVKAFRPAGVRRQGGDSDGAGAKRRGGVERAAEPNIW